MGTINMISNCSSLLKIQHDSFFDTKQIDIDKLNKQNNLIRYDENDIETLSPNNSIEKASESIASINDNQCEENIFLNFLIEGKDNSSYIDISTLKYGIEIIELKNIYKFSNESEVFEFLWNHQIMISELKTAYYKIKQYFPSNINSILLDIFRAPESLSSPILFISIYTNMSFEDAQDCMDKIDNKYYHNLSKKFRLLFNFNLNVI